LDHKLSPFRNRSRVTFHGYGTAKNACSDKKRAFYLAASHRQIKKSLLCVLGVSAVKILFWTRMIEYVFSYGEEEEQEIRDKIGSEIIGFEGFRRSVEKRAIETRRPKIGRHKK